MKPPMRKVVEYIPCSGTMHLECGHIAGKRPESKYPAKTRCVACMPMKERQDFIYARR
jgi:hypothetical protein